MNYSWKKEGYFDSNVAIVPRNYVLGLIYQHPLVKHDTKEWVVKVVYKEDKASKTEENRSLSCPDKDVSVESKNQDGENLANRMNELDLSRKEEVLQPKCSDPGVTEAIENVVDDKDEFSDHEGRLVIDEDALVDSSNKDETDQNPGYQISDLDSSPTEDSLQPNDSDPQADTPVEAIENVVDNDKALNYEEDGLIICSDDTPNQDKNLGYQISDLDSSPTEDSLQPNDSDPEAYTPVAAIENVVDNEDKASNSEEDGFIICSDATPNQDENLGYQISDLDSSPTEDSLQPHDSDPEADTPVKAIENVVDNEDKASNNEEDGFVICSVDTSNQDENLGYQISDLDLAHDEDFLQPNDSDPEAVTPVKAIENVADNEDKASNNEEDGFIICSGNTSNQDENLGYQISDLDLAHDEEFLQPEDSDPEFNAPVEATKNVATLEKKEMSLQETENASDLKDSESLSEDEDWCDLEEDISKFSTMREYIELGHK